MAVIGINLTKINAEKKFTTNGKIDVSNNIEITEVKEAGLEMGNTQEKGLQFGFKFNSTYDPDVGNVTIEGDLLYTASPKKSKETADSWKKDKKITDQEMLMEILNVALRKCSVEALIISKELLLPSPIPMPVFRKEK